jgi:hypothetical protein
MSFLGIRKPGNAILAAGTPMVTQKKVETATNMYPGRLVKKGTNDDDVVVNTAAGACYGWLGYEQCMDAASMPADVDTIYEANAQAPVLFGGHFVVVGCLTTSQTIVAGDRLVAAANGMVQKAVAATATTGAATASAVDATTPTIDGSVGSDGIIIGIAMESVTTTSSEADILVHSLI